MAFRALLDIRSFSLAQQSPKKDSIHPALCR
jgi:hypothetical protein